MLIAINYHYVRPAFDTPYPGIRGVTPAELAAQLELLGRVGEFVSPRRLRNAVQGRATLPERAFIVTFDDGLREQYEHALPVLRRLGVPALFFVNTRPLAEGTVSAVHQLHLLRAMLPPAEVLRLLHAEAPGGLRLDDDPALLATARAQYPYDPPETAQLKYALNVLFTHDVRDALVGRCFAAAFEDSEAEWSRRLYLDVRQLRDLANADQLGTHGHDHLPLGLLAPSHARLMLSASQTWLERWTGRYAYALSYPYGHSREASAPWVGRLAAREGMVFAFTMERAANPDLDAPLHLARFACNDLPGGTHVRYDAATLFETVATRRWAGALAELPRG